MRPLVHVVAYLIVFALGFWAYRENYSTQDGLREVARLQDEIIELQEALAVQRAEWAYLNRPDRLRELATLNFDRLGLLPLAPGQLTGIAAVAHPPVELPLAFDAPVDVQGELTEEGL